MRYGILRYMTFASSSQPPHVDARDDGDHGKRPGCGSRYLGIETLGLINPVRIRPLRMPSSPPGRATYAQWNDLGNIDMFPCTNDARSPLNRDSHWIGR